MILATTLPQLLAYTSFLLVILAILLVVTILFKANQSDLQTAFRYISECRGYLNSVQKLIAQEEIDTIYSYEEKVEKKIAISERIITQIIYEKGEFNELLIAKNQIADINSKMNNLKEQLHNKDFIKASQLVSEIIISFNLFNEKLEKSKKRLEEHKKNFSISVIFLDK